MKEELQLDKTINKIRTKVFKSLELTVTEKVFATWYIKEFISEKVASGSQELKFEKIWNIRTYSALKEFQEKLKISNISYEDEEKQINVLKWIFKLQQALNKDKSGSHSGIQEEVSKYYRECFVKNVTDDKILFESNNKKLVVSFLDNTIILTDKQNKKEYVRDISLKELTIFPNSRLAHQYIK